MQISIFVWNNRVERLARRLFNRLDELSRCAAGEVQIELDQVWIRRSHILSRSGCALRPLLRWLPKHRCGR